VFESLVSTLRPFQFRGKARIMAPWIRRSGVRTVRLDGYRIELDLTDYIQRMIFLGAYERWESRIVRRLLQPGMCVVDVGANIGYFTLLAARRVGRTGRVFAIEPSPYAADRLDKTISKNEISHVRLERCGLGQRRGEVLLYDAEKGNHSPTMLGDSGTPGKLVPIRSLDECVREWSIDRIDLLKVDVEGYEPEVFAGAADTMASGGIRAILCEFNTYWLTRARTSPREVYRRLLAQGYVDGSGIAREPGDCCQENRLLLWGSRRA
jgi:FkbM family methyltransferase